MAVGVCDQQAGALFDANQTTVHVEATHLQSAAKGLDAHRLKFGNVRGDSGGSALPCPVSSTSIHLSKSGQRNEPPSTLVVAVVSDASDVRARISSNFWAHPDLDFGVVLYRGSVSAWVPEAAKASDAGRTFRVRQGSMPAGVAPGDFIPKLWFQAQVSDWVAGALPSNVDHCSKCTLMRFSSNCSCSEINPRFNLANAKVTKDAKARMRPRSLYYRLLALCCRL